MKRHGFAMAAIVVALAACAQLRIPGILTELPPYAMVFTVRSGKLVRWRTFPNQESALKAVGLEG